MCGCVHECVRVSVCVEVWVGLISREIQMDHGNSKKKINTPEVTHSIRKYTTVHQVSALHRVLAFVLIPNEMYMTLGD